MFIRSIFGKQTRIFGGSLLPQDRIDDSIHENGTSLNLPEPVRIIHKEQESISAFCLNQVVNVFVSSNGRVGFSIPFILESKQARS